MFQYVGYQIVMKLCHENFLMRRVPGDRVRSVTEKFKYFLMIRFMSNETLTKLSGGTRAT